MKLFNKQEFENAKFRDKLPCNCDFCGKEFLRDKRDVFNSIKRNNKKDACSKKCQDTNLVTKKMLECRNCGKPFYKTPSEIKKTKNHFCSRSCSGTHTSLNKTHGTRRSKLEVWLEKELPLLFPDLEFHFNRKDTINSELDIYIPSLKLAFELNGIFHYEPIYGEDKLSKIQNNDQRKFQACLEKGIELCIIDSSGLKYFKPANVKKYLDIIVSVITQKCL